MRMNVEEGDANSNSNNNNHDKKCSPQDDDDDSTILCPLFMDCLPSNFEQNPGLAAIASLLDEEINEEDETKRKAVTKERKDKEGRIRRVAAVPIAGGGKSSRSRRRCPRSSSIMTSSSPYPTIKNKNDTKNNSRQKKSSTVGEAQLYLKLWKI